MSVINATTMNNRLTNTTNNTKPVSNKQIKPYILVVEDINEGIAQKQFIINSSQNEGLSDQSDEETDRLQNTSTYYENKESDESEYIWSHKRSSERDTQATEYFLQIRSEEKYKQSFVDKKISKNKLWMSIAKEMNKAGYYVGDGREGAERCRQKFSNLEKSFLKYIQHIRSDARNKRQPPPFYEFMVNIVDPDDRLYKFEQLDAVEVLTSNPNLPSSSKYTQEDKQKVQHNEIVTLLKKQHSEMMNVQREFLDKIDKHLTVQNEQRERMITSFINAMKNNCNSCDNTKKRKHNSVDDSQTENI